MYTHFDYLKVLETLKGLKEIIEGTSMRAYDGPKEPYFLIIKSFDDSKNRPIHVLDVLSGLSEDMLSFNKYFPLIEAEFGEEDCDYYFFFQMRESTCLIKDLSADGKIFEIISEVIDKESNDWRYVLSLFIAKINIIIKEKLVIYNM